MVSLIKGSKAIVVMIFMSFTFDVLAEDDIFSKFKARLNLSDEQIQQFEPILTDHREKLLSVMKKQGINPNPGLLKDKIGFRQLRTIKKDIDQVRLALAGHESRSRLATRIGPYELYRKHADNPNIRSKLISGSRTAVSYAKDYFPEVQYYLNYAGMRDPKFMTELSQEVADAGATHVIVADSQSTFTPSQISDFTQQLVTAIGHQAKIGVHCHNMYGMAVANSVAAVEAGAVQVEATVGGIGDAGGNTALEQIEMYAEVFGKNVAPWDHSFQIKAIYSLAQELTRLTGFTFASNHPLVGPDTFKIEAGIHQTQILQVNPGLAPEWIGRTAEIVLGRHSGIQGIRLKAEELGIQTKDINWHHVYRLLMDKAASQGMLEDRDLHDAIDQSQHE